MGITIIVTMTLFLEEFKIMLKFEPKNYTEYNLETLLKPFGMDSL